MIPRVIIVGRGFGGLYTARALHRAPVNVTPLMVIIFSIGSWWNHLRFSAFSSVKCREDFICGGYSCTGRVILVGQDDDPHFLLRDICYIRPEAVG